MPELVRPSDPDWQYADSSNVHAFRLWPLREELEIWFWRKLAGGAKIPGPKYRYHGVDERTYGDMLRAPSKGKFVRQRLIPWHVVTGPE